jgi:predicted MFS family arabinose efflux permease
MAALTPRRVSLSLFLCVFAAQSGLIALAPVLPEVAADLGVSTAAAGQLRTVAAVVAALASLAVPEAARRLGLARLLAAGAGLTAAGSLASAAAPTLPLLALGQVPIGVGVSILTAAAASAAGEWAPEAARGRVLGWALTGSPAAWIVGMPAIGLLGPVSWRLGWLVLPFAASLAALASVPVRRERTGRPERRDGLRAAVADPALTRWLLAELATNAAWLGTLVYAGALFAETYGSSPAWTGAALALAAAAFVLGNLVFRRFAGAASPLALVRLALGMAVFVGLFGVVRAAPAASGALLGNAYGLAAAPERRVAAMAARAAANQVGAFLGAAAAGAALSAGGYTAFGAVLALGLVLSALPLAGRPAAGAPGVTGRRRARATSPARRRRAAAPARAR